MINTSPKPKPDSSAYRHERRGIDKPHRYLAKDIERRSRASSGVIGMFTGMFRPRFAGRFAAQSKRPRDWQAGALEEFPAIEPYRLLLRGRFRPADCRTAFVRWARDGRTEQAAADAFAARRLS